LLSKCSVHQAKIEYAFQNRWSENMTLGNRGNKTKRC
jgi:hypothetical protein